jgi:hypothetical protein
MELKLMQAVLQVLATRTHRGDFSLNVMVVLFQMIFGQELITRAAVISSQPNKETMILNGTNRYICNQVQSQNRMFYTKIVQLVVRQIENGQTCLHLAIVTQRHNRMVVLMYNIKRIVTVTKLLIVNALVTLELKALVRVQVGVSMK